MKKLSKKILLTTLILTLFLITISSANATDVHMNSTNNTIANVVENDTDNGDKIYLDEGTYNHTHLNGTDGINIDKNLTIIGKGADKTIIDAQKLGRIFYIRSDGILTLINLTLINGNSTDDWGGAIFNNYGKLTLTNCVLDNNNAGSGGAIFNYRGDNMTVNNCTFSDNDASNGGAIYNYLSDYITINNSFFIENTASYNGGAIYNEGGTYFNINNTKFSNNKASSGGAIYNNENIPMRMFGAFGANMTIINSKFINNTADFGGAIYNNFGDNFTVINSSFVNNTANEASAIFNGYSDNLAISNSNFTNNKGEATIVINGRNATMISCNVFNNTQGILIGGDSDAIINYNRIFNNTNNTGYNLDDGGIGSDLDFNWWGDNNPLVNGTLNNYFIMNVTNATSLDSNGTVTFQYTFKLNNTDSFNATLLPYFVTDVYTNLTNGVIESFDARYDNVFDITVNTSGDILYTFITDNEVQILEGIATIPDPVDPIDPIDPVDPIDPFDPVDPDNDNNQTSNNPTASAVMKETGIPIMAILLVLLSSLGLVTRKK